MTKIIVVVGPTAVGKTDLSIALAKKYDAIIINADSTQIYKEINIGTAKITKKEQKNIVHHLLDIKSLDEDYSIYDFQKDGRALIEKYQKENKNIIIVGGSGLYIRSLLYDYRLGESVNTNEYEEFTNEELKNKILEIYPDSEIHMNNRKRMVRFLNNYEKTGKIIKNKEEKNIKLYDFIMIGLETDRETLYEKINSRVDKMIENGLIQEARSLHNKKYDRLNLIIGYSELNEYFENKITLEEAITKTKASSRQYAKRQFTWFKNQEKDIVWFKTDYEDFNSTIKEVEKYLKNVM